MYIHRKIYAYDIRIRYTLYLIITLHNIQDCLVNIFLDYMIYMYKSIRRLTWYNKNIFMHTHRMLEVSINIYIILYYSILFIILFILILLLYYHVCLIYTGAWSEQALYFCRIAIFSRFNNRKTHFSLV